MTSHRALCRGLVLAAAISGGTEGRRAEIVPMRVRAGVAAELAADGAHLAVGDAGATIRTAALGRVGTLAPLDRLATPVVSGAEVRSDRGRGVVEWWRALTSGLEHGVSVGSRPPGQGELELELEVTGGLVVRSPSDDAIELVDGRGVAVATYAHLVVVDATGARLPARMSTRDGAIALHVEDAHARYPIVVDPILVTQELENHDSVPGDMLGLGVALSGDGIYAVVARPGADDRGSDTGGAFVFRRTGTTWANDEYLYASAPAAGDRAGTAVAIDADGTRVLVGVANDSLGTTASAGSVRVFLRTGITWIEEATLTASDAAPFDAFGGSVALTPDGTRALVGVSGDDTTRGPDAGSARVFTRIGTTWAEEAALTSSDAGAADGLGSAVAITPDGTRALVGAWGDMVGSFSAAGSARVFARIGTTWAEEATLTAADPASVDQLGIAVSLAADGSRALVGAPRDDTARGADAGTARVFARTGTTWSEETTLAMTAAGAMGDLFGSSVALSADGGRALVGASSDDIGAASDTGSAFIFTRTGTTWALDTSPNRGTQAYATDGFGDLGRAHPRREPCDHRRPVLRLRRRLDDQPRLLVRVHRRVAERRRLHHWTELPQRPLRRRRLLSDRLPRRRRRLPGLLEHAHRRRVGNLRADPRGHALSAERGSMRPGRRGVHRHQRGMSRRHVRGRRHPVPNFERRVRRGRGL